MSRTLVQLDLAVEALETQVPQINAGLQETLRQNTLALESEYQSINAKLGRPLDENGAANPTGFYSTFAALQTMLESVTQLASQLSAQMSDMQVQVTANQTTIANLNTGFAAMDLQIQQLQQGH